MTLTKAVVLAQAPSTVPVANRALLCHALDWLAQGGVREAAVIVPQELAGRAHDAVAAGRCDLRLSWVEPLPDETPAIGTLATGLTDHQPRPWSGKQMVADRLREKA